MASSSRRFRRFVLFPLSLPLRVVVSVKLRVAGGKEPRPAPRPQRAPDLLAGRSSPERALPLGVAQNFPFQGPSGAAAPLYVGQGAALWQFNELFMCLFFVIYFVS